MFCSEVLSFKHLNFTSSSGKAAGSNQHLMFFPSPGHDVPITVELFKKISTSFPRSSTCHETIENSFHHDSDDCCKEEVCISAAMF
jgi:hypothetical protein